MVASGDASGGVRGVDLRDFDLFGHVVADVDFHVQTHGAAGLRHHGGDGATNDFGEGGHLAGHDLSGMRLGAGAQNEPRFAICCRALYWEAAGVL